TMSAQQMIEKTASTMRTNFATGPALRMSSAMPPFALAVPGTRSSCMGGDPSSRARSMIPDALEGCQFIRAQRRGLFDRPMWSPYKKAMFRSPGPIAIHAGPFTLRWYGLLMATEMAVGLWLARREARGLGARAAVPLGLDAEDLLRAAELALLGGLVGARLYYVAFNLDYYSMVPAKIFAV